MSGNRGDLDHDGGTGDSRRRRDSRQILEIEMIDVKDVTGILPLKKEELRTVEKCWGL